MKHRILLFVVTIIILLIVSGCSSTTPLIKASTQGNYLSVQKLINEGANINEPDSNGMTPLMHAILCQNVEAIETLIKKGADLSIKDKSGYTALYYAVYNNNYTIVKSLIDNGADVNAQDLSGATVLHHSAIWKYSDKNTLQILEYILSHNANTALKDKNGWTVLENSLYYKNIDMVALIRKKTDWKQNISPSTFGDAFDEALRSPSCYKPANGMFDVSSDKEHVYKIAIDDCNHIVVPSRRGLLLTTGVGYVAGLAIDAVTVKEKFINCMEKMGFKCINNCSK